MKVKNLLIETVFTLLIFALTCFNVSAQCTAPTYSAGTPYATGQQVQNAGKLYRCDVGGWCSSVSAYYYEPGAGTAWTTAWTEIGTCSGSTATLTTITITPSSTSVAKGSTKQFTATGKDQSGNTIAITPTWTVSGGGTISSSGLFTANTAGGPFTVTATQGTVKGTASVTVTETTPVLTSITLSPTSASVTKGSTRQFTATGKDQSGNTMTITPTWTVSGGGTISSSGLFTASTVGGPFTVTATQGTIKGTATVTVTETTPVLTSITLSPTSTSVTKGSTSQFTATGKDQSGNTMTITPTWTVSGGGTISSSGLFTASTAGGPFTVTATQGTIKGTASVTVTESTTCTVPAWNSTTVYSSPGNVVSYNGRKYSNQWWTQGETPGMASVWKDGGLCGGTTNQPPSISFTAPSSTVTQNTLGPITLTATATDTDGTISSVVFTVESKTFTATSSGSGSYSASWTPSAFGSYTITAIAKDNGGASATKTMSVTVNQGTSTDPGTFLLTEAQYLELFPYRYGYDANTGVRDPSKDFYSYANFKEAVNRMKQIEATFERRTGTNYYRITHKNKSTGKTTVIRNDPEFATTTSSIITRTVDYGTFANEGTTTQKKRELAAFLANISQETTGGWDTAPGGRYAWGLYFREEVGYENGAMIGYRWENHPTYPPAPGKSYHGRGPIQLSWNYNYGYVSAFLFADKNILLNNPEKVIEDGALAFQTAIWFWMTPQWPKPSAHDVMVGKWSPSTYDTSKGRKAGFGMTVNIINGGIECGSGSEFVKVTHRIGHYNRYVGILAVSNDLDGTTDCSECGCANQFPFGKEVEPDAGTFARLEDNFADVPVTRNRARIFPNPSRGTFNIEFSLQTPSAISVNLLNNLGVKLAKLVEGKEKAGTHIHPTTLDHLPTGVYYLEVVTDSGVQRLPLIIK